MSTHTHVAHDSLTDMLRLMRTLDTPFDPDRDEFAEDTPDMRLMRAIGAGGMKLSAVEFGETWTRVELYTSFAYGPEVVVDVSLVCDGDDTHMSVWHAIVTTYPRDWDLRKTQFANACVNTHMSVLANTCFAATMHVCALVSADVIAPFGSHHTEHETGADNTGDMWEMTHVTRSWSDADYKRGYVSGGYAVMHVDAWPRFADALEQAYTPDWPTGKVWMKATLETRKVHDNVWLSLAADRN